MKKLLFLLLLVPALFSCSSKNEITREQMFKQYADSLRIKMRNADHEGLVVLVSKLNEWNTIEECKKLLASPLFIDTIKPFQNNFYSMMIKDLENRESPEAFGKKNFKTNFDEFEKTTWYKSKLIPEFVDKNKMSIYAGSKDGLFWFRYTINYTGDDWIFFEEAKLISGNRETTLIIPRKDKVEDNSGGTVWEYIDAELKDNASIFFESLKEDSEVKYRLSGSTKSYTGKLSSANVKGLVQMIKFKYMVDDYKYFQKTIDDAKSKLIK